MEVDNSKDDVQMVSDDSNNEDESSDDENKESEYNSRKAALLERVRIQMCFCSFFRQILPICFSPPRSASIKRIIMRTSN